MNWGILYDWSGTLMNNFERVYETSMLIFDHFNTPRIDRNTYRNQNTGPYMEFWNRYFPDLAKTRQNQLFATFMRKVAPADMHPGAIDTLRHFAQTDVLQFIATSQPAEQIQAEILRHDWPSSIVVYPQLEHKIDAYKKIIEDHQLAPQNIIAIADTAQEINAAKLMGFTTIAIDWGFHTTDFLRTVGPDHIVSDLISFQKIVTDICTQASADKI